MNNFAELEIGQLLPSPSNPRKTFIQADLESLADSIRTQGVIQPIVVRLAPESLAALPITDNPSHPSLDRYEIVSGERRYRGSMLAGKETIPAIIRELTDEQVLEIQIVENLQRQDVDPLEEAQAFTFLHSNYKSFTSEEIALRVGKSASYVRRRMSLVSLVPEAGTLFRDGHLTLQHCLLLCRLNPAEQETALRFAVNYNHNIISSLLQDKPDHSGPKVSYVQNVKELKSFIQRNFYLDLESAAFDKKDETLCPDAGSCHLCPKRTGYNLSLFEDLSDKDRCTDSACYADKTASHVKKMLSKNKKLVKLTNNWNNEDESLTDEDDIVLLEKMDEEERALVDKKLIRKGIYIDGQKEGHMVEFVHENDMPIVPPRLTKNAAEKVKAQQKKWDPENNYQIKQEIEKRIIQSVLSSELTAHQEQLLFLISFVVRSIYDDDYKVLIFQQMQWEIVTEEGDVITDDDYPFEHDDYSPERTMLHNLDGKKEGQLLEILRKITMVKMVDSELSNNHFKVRNMLEFDGIKVEDITEEYRLEWEAEHGAAE